MWDRLKIFFDSTMFAPHGICLQWEPELLTVHIVSDAIIALSYFSIPFALAYFVSKRKDVEFGWVFWAFAAFIMACGITHLFSIYTLWVPVYGLEGLAKAVTAAVSIATAIVLWPLIPKLLTIPSPGQLKLAHGMLEAEARQRKEAETLLRQSQKMEAIGQLTGGIAHDFNNLLMVISGNLEIAQRALTHWNEASHDRIAKVVANASSGARTAATLTQRLLSFARKQPFDSRVVNANQLIGGISDFFRRSLGESIDLEVVAAAGLWTAETDPHQLESALLNLVVNARDAIGGGGKLTIETANSYVDDQYAKLNADVKPGQYVVISVTDNGGGMDENTRERAFEPFFSTKETGRGTGLGLSQVYGFAKQSGGFVKLYSELGQGTTVRIYLPRSEQSADQKDNFSVPDNEVKGAGETILVVEDDEAVRQYVVDTLADLNYRVLQAANAAEALEVFNSNGRKIDLLLTDVVMPGKNGRALSEELIVLNSQLKVIFMTGYSRNAIVHHGRLDRGVELLQKPVSQTALGRKVRAVLR